MFTVDGKYSVKYERLVELVKKAYLELGKIPSRGLGASFSKDYATPFSVIIELYGEDIGHPLWFKGLIDGWEYVDNKTLETLENSDLESEKFKEYLEGLRYGSLLAEEIFHNWSESPKVGSKPRISKLRSPSPIGPNLRIWDIESSRDRQNWEKELQEKAKEKGIVQVYSPHIYNKNIQKFLKVPKSFRANLASSAEEAYFGHKWFNHVAMFVDKEISYKELPIILYEVSDIFDSYPDGTGSQLGIYITAISTKNEAEFIAEFIDKAANNNIYSSFRTTYFLDKENKLNYLNEKNQILTPSITIGIGTYSHTQEFK